MGDHYAELLPYLHLEDSLIYSAAPYRKNGAKGVGYQIDLLLQTKRSQCVVEIKRRTSIKKSIIDEVAAKIAKMKKSPGMSIRAALVYDGNRHHTIQATARDMIVLPRRTLRTTRRGTARRQRGRFVAVVLRNGRSHRLQHDCGNLVWQ